MDASEKREQAGADRLALGLLLLLSFGLNAWAIDWGLPSPSGWAPDELLPSAVLEGMSRHFSGGWHDKYPPFHYYLLSVLYAPGLKAEHLPTGMPLPPEAYHRLFLIGRGLSLLMAAGTLLLVYRCGREAGDRRAGLLAAAITALMAPFVYYAKLANLEVPYLFWWVLSLLFLLKVLDRHRRRDYLLLAATAVLAVTTKDQAYGLYALTVPLVAGNDLGGHAALLASTLRHLAFTLGLPGFVIGLLGLVEAARRREGRWLVLLVPAVSFYVCFLSVVLYVYDRFALPLAVVAALFGGRWLSQGWNARGWVRATARGAAAITIAYGATRVVGLDLSMTNDARYAAEDWLRANAGAGLGGAIGPAEYLPRLLGLNARPIGAAIARIETLKPAYVVVNADYAARADDASAEHALYEGLEAGTLGYQEAWRYRYHPPWPLLDTALLVERTGREPLRTNLGKVNPEVVVYRRTDAEP